ncbi:hypothetical protein [Streptomyces sp. NPDC060187]|uniref:hypothetical protein n=1 Tax=Streptomyces sp. NPDC060187 TaxID=3347067 RepID=UPI00365B4015
MYLLRARWDGECALVIVFIYHSQEIVALVVDQDRRPRIPRPGLRGVPLTE